MLNARNTVTVRGITSRIQGFVDSLAFCLIPPVPCWQAPPIPVTYCHGSQPLARSGQPGAFSRQHRPRSRHNFWPAGIFDESNLAKGTNQGKERRPTNHSLPFKRSSNLRFPDLANRPQDRLSAGQPPDPTTAQR